VGNSIGVLVLGVLALLTGALFIAAGQSLEYFVAWSVLALGFALPLTALGLYGVFHLPEGQSVKERRKAKKKINESLPASVLEAPTYELYNAMLMDSVREYGPQIGWQMLERRLEIYMQTGLTRSEAVRRLAAEKGY